jgi:hypothetical protein
MTLNGSTVASVSPAWNTTDTLVQAIAGNQPNYTLLGPNGESLLKYNKSLLQYATFTDTGILLRATAAFVIAPQIGGSTLGLFGRGNSNTSNIAISSAGALLVRTVGAGASVTITLPASLNANLQVLVLVYDSTINGGQVTPYLDGIAGTPTINVGAGGLDFARIGAQGLTSTSPYNGYMGAALLYNRALSTNEAQFLSNYLNPRRGLKLYVSTAGNDSSETPWHPSTPLLSPVTAVATTLHGGETICLKGGDDFRLSSRLLPYASIPSGRTAHLNGNSWGNTASLARMRFSVAPTLSLTSGTVYDCGIVTAPHAGTDGSGSTNHIYYVPGGIPTFSGPITGYENSNVIRLTQVASTNSPASGTWSLYSDNHIYVNAGTTLTTGDIEIPQAPSGFIVAAIYNNLTSHWHYSSFDICFADATGFQNRGSQDISLTGVKAYCNTLDGIDTTQGTNGDGTKTVRVRCVTMLNGSGLTAGSGGPGDGFSDHEDVTGEFYYCIAVNNDKSGFDHLTGTTTLHEGCLAYGNNPFWYNTSSTWAAGSYVARNCISIVPAGLGSYKPIGFRHNAQASSGTPIMTIQQCTAYSLSNAANYNGIEQSSSSSVIVAQNNIVVGFNIGMKSAVDSSNWTKDHNLLFGNTTNYSLVTAGTGDVTGNPLFVNAPIDLSLAAGSPAKTAGASLGIITDYLGRVRGVPPSIGGIE